ncbi:MAG: acetyl-CoA synthase subunit gamma [Deltaproteobacteria bacterium]|nr:acetyl-CoA synthase subunit gamma [Deltaproteobacteria bacterium]
MDTEKLNSTCCPPDAPPADKGVKSTCCAGPGRAPINLSASSGIETVTSELTLSDRFNAVRCRLGGFRMHYIVRPGIYAVGAPGPDSDVFVSANYRLSFNVLRRSLRNMNAWILVIDTKGINVWCAAGKGAFGTDELVGRIFETRLSNIVNHRRIILPQLGGPGVAGHLVQKQTGFKVLWGPVNAADIRAYVEAGYKASKAMRSVRFNLFDRLILTPMELVPALKIFPLYALAVLLVFALAPTGISATGAEAYGLPFLVMAGAAVFSGAFLTPVLLPYIPNRSFAIKGWLTGLLTTVVAARSIGIYSMPDALIIMTFVFFPLLSSYIALQFTGATTFTGPSGVKKELRYAMPLYITAAGASIVLIIAFKLSQWGVL